MTKTKNKTSGKITEAYKSLRYVTLLTMILAKKWYSKVQRGSISGSLFE